MSIKNRYIFNQMAVAKGWLIKTFLLLLLLFVACGEPDDMFGTIYGDDEEIELTINTLLPDGGISTRTAPAENITSITALAFDRNYELIKVQTSEVVQSTTSNTTGTFKVTVPQRTRRIHFIAKNNGEFTEITESDYGKTDVGLLVNRISSIQNSQDADGISNALHYWQMLDFVSAEDLKDLSDELQALDTIKTDDGYQLPLIRNMAKITLNLQNGMTGHIAGILNYNTTGTIVPYLKDGNNYTFGYQDTINHELPSTFVITSDVSDCSELGTVHYLFEEYNDVGDLIYVMCYIDNDGSGTEDSGHFYKVALVKPTFTGVEDKYYYVIRNQSYNINIVGKLDVTLGKTNYSDAVQYGKPINDSEKEQVHLDFEPDEVYMYIGEPGTVTVKIPEGITDLQIGFPSERFDADGVIAKNTAGNNLENSTTTNGNIHISIYDVTGLCEIVLSMNLKSSIQDAISGMELQFIGSGEDKIVNDKLVVHVLKRDALNVTPTAVEIPRTKGNSFSVNVIIPSFDNYDGAYELTINDKDNKYNITAPGTLVLQNGVYNVEKGQTYTFEFELREDGTAGDKDTIDFHLDTDYHNYDATTIVTLIDESDDVNITVEVVDEDANNVSMTYGQNSEEDLYVKVTIPAGVTTLAFSSEYFDIASASDLKKDGGEAYLSGSGNSYTVNHQGEESITLPFRLRLKNSVPNTSATFTFTGTGETINETSATKNVTLQQRNPDDGSVYWEGYLPLNQADNTTKISIPKSALTVGRVMRIECGEPSDGQALALLNNWNQFNPDMQYSTETIDVPLTQEFVNSITDNLIITGRGAEGMLMKKVSFLQLQTVQITAALTPQITSLNYTTNENSVSELIVNVTIPAGVTTLNFSSDYFDVEFINSTSLTDNGNGSYTVTGNAQISADARLRLKNKTATQDAGFTFSGTGEGVMVTPATINNITLQANGDENVRWQGNVDLSYDNDARKIVLPYSWFSSVPAGSKLRVEYDILSTDGPIIQFSEVKDEWDNPGFHFPELETTTDDRTIGCNLSDRKSNTGYWIYGTNESAFTGSASFDLTLSQDVLTALADNRRPNLFGGEDIVIAIQGKNVRLKKISVIPNNNPVNGDILVALPNGTAQSDVSTSLNYASGESSLEEFTVDVTVPAGVTQINIAADDFDVRTEPTSTITTYSFAQSAEEQTKRFKFTLKANNKSDKNSTITISDNSGNATSATVTVDLSPRAADANGKYTVWSGLMDLEWTRNYLAVNSYLPIGTQVTLNFTSSAEGGSFEMQDCNETAFRLNGVSYPEGDDWIGVGNGTNNYQFTITDQTTIKDSNGNYVAIQNPINGLRINGSGLIMTSIVVDYSGVTGETFSYDFEDESKNGIVGWGNSSTQEIVTENESKVLKLYNPSKVNSWEAQVAFDRIFVPGNYTLTYRIKGDATGTIDQGFQYFYDPIETDSQFKNASDYPQTNVTTDWQEKTIQFSVTRACNRFLLNIGQYVGNIYIDNLTLEKN